MKLMLTKNTDKLRSEVAAHVAADSVVQGNYWDAENHKGCFIGCLAKGNYPTISEAEYGLPVMVQRIAESIFEGLAPDEAKAFFAALPDAVSCDGKDLSKVGWQFLAAELRALPAQSAEIQSVIDPVIAGMDLLASGQEWAAGAWAADAAARADARRRQRDLLLRLIREAPVVGDPMFNLSLRAQRLVDEFTEGVTSGSIAHGIANVLQHLADTEGDAESWYAVPASTLVHLAADLRAPTLLDRALAGDPEVARRFLREAGFIDADGQLAPQYRSPES